MSFNRRKGLLNQKTIGTPGFIPIEVTLFSCLIKENPDHFRSHINMVFLLYQHSVVDVNTLNFHYRQNHNFSLIHYTLFKCTHMLFEDGSGFQMLNQWERACLCMFRHSGSVCGLGWWVELLWHEDWSEQRNLSSLTEAGQPFGHRHRQVQKHSQLSLHCSLMSLESIKFTPTVPEYAQCCAQLSHTYVLHFWLSD